MIRHLHKEHVQCWLALALTTGEFVAGGWLLVQHGHVLALYLAVTYAMRETSGGKHYHEIVLALVRKARKNKHISTTTEVSDAR